MTEKRFEMIITSADGSFHYLDKITGEKIISTLELENKLNELNNENEQLKAQLDSEHQMLDNAILLERTRMGKNSLQQYKEAIQ